MFVLCVVLLCCFLFHVDRCPVSHMFVLGIDCVLCPVYYDRVLRVCVFVGVVVFMVALCCYYALRVCCIYVFVFGCLVFWLLGSLCDSVVHVMLVLHLLP